MERTKKSWRAFTKSTYLRLIFGLARVTPKYIVLDKTKRDMLEIEIERIAVKFEEKIRIECANAILRNGQKQ